MKKLFVPIILSYLRFWARFSLSLHKPFIIGIAGTAGKSSTRNALYAILKDNFRTKYAYGNSETGLPLGILGIYVEGVGIFDWISIVVRAPLGIFYLSGVRYLIAEMGIDEPTPPKNMEYLLTILKPNIAIYLNEGSVHTMQFESFVKDKTFSSEQEKIDFLITKLAEEDVRIITKSGANIGIYNADDKFVHQQIKNYIPSKKQTLLSFGSSDKNDGTYKSYKVTLEGTTFIIKTKQDEYILHFSNIILPEAYGENFAASILAAEQLGLTKDPIEQSLTKNFTLPPGRSSLFSGIKNSVIIDSSYNASKMATLSFLELLKKLKKETGKKIVFVFGDMREIGSGEGAEHQEIAEKISGIVDYLYCVGKVTREFVLPIAERDKSIQEIRWFQTSRELGKYLAENLPKESIVLVKGSQNTIFLEEAIKSILKEKSDRKKLCRQEEYWMRIKQNYFNNHE